MGYYGQCPCHCAPSEVASFLGAEEPAYWVYYSRLGTSPCLLPSATSTLTYLFRWRLAGSALELEEAELEEAASAVAPTFKLPQT